MLAIAVHYYPDEEAKQRTMLLSVLILLGITALWRALRDGDGDRARGDTRFRLVGLAAVPIYLLAMYWPISNQFFRLAPLGWLEWLWVLGWASAGLGLCSLSDIWVKKILMSEKNAQ